ncbi:hypothetical protein FOMPIDRAFT_1126871 [Fomitopsis schrenkii]|uniref:Uncharacterized protein n=1 Tax=Fomitopsis schrenkii TaxID=2126942 RepID=S8FIR6_FOMSC|nr:hypothetical protein FOMPIDRAFT_1126871 [Fomitopsis schrenkii]
MHLIWENTIKNLVLHWTGDFKGLSDGREEYELGSEVWKAVGQATAAAGRTIPAAFGGSPPNPEKDKSACTADSWSLWTLYIGPVLLARRFKKRKYYDHFVALVKLLNLCLQFEMSDDDIEEVRVGFIDWVQAYEKIYYQHDPARVSTCPVTIHALLHISDYIKAAGPVWASWAFPMERFCGYLQPTIRSRRFPYANIDRHILAVARLDHIKKVYSAEESLALTRRRVDQGTEISGYTTCKFLRPCTPTRTRDIAVLESVIGALATRFNRSAAVIRSALPTHAELWHRIKILPDGDVIHADGSYKARRDTRDATFVRYDTIVDKNARFPRRPVVNELRSFFGQLRYIIVLHFPICQSLGLQEPTPIALAAIRSCPIIKSHKDLDIHYYGKEGAIDVLDLMCVQCVVGRVKDGHGWAIIDRSGSLSRAIYAPREEEGGNS